MMSEALLSRFEEHMEVTTDYDMLASHLGADPRVCSFAKIMDGKRQGSEVTWAPQTREVLQFTRSMKRSGVEHAVANLLGKFAPQDRDIAMDIAKGEFGLVPQGHLALR
jgi:hypothetical protein